MYKTLEISVGYNEEKGFDLYVILQRIANTIVKNISDPYIDLNYTQYEEEFKWGVLEGGNVNDL